MTTALEGGEGSASRPGRSLLTGNTRYPLYRRLGGPHGRSGQVRKISPPPRFDPRTVQPVASRYTDYTTWPTLRYPAHITLPGPHYATRPTLRYPAHTTLPGPHVVQLEAVKPCIQLVMVSELQFYRRLNRGCLPMYELLFYKMASGDACSISFKFVAKLTSSTVVCLRIQY